MEDVKIQLNESGRGAFTISEAGQTLGKMVVSTSPGRLTAHHTEVLPEAEGKGIGKKLFEAMVTYARSNQLKVMPLCVFVLGQFRRHPDQYLDIWEKQGTE
jgi:predicted GNAT family acetyltransferase